HLRWIEKRQSGPMWAHLMSREQIAEFLEKQRATRNRYQKKYRCKLKELGGVRAVREANYAKDVERTKQERELSKEAARAAGRPEGMSEFQYARYLVQQSWDAAD